jgi:hypothetical protein
MKAKITALLAVGALTVAALAIAPGSVNAQEFRSTLAGEITDPSGAVVPGALITAVKNDTQQTHTAKTNHAGLYTISYMLPGMYTATVTARGFKTFTQEKVVLLAGQGYGLNVRLEVGAVTQSVTVSSAPPLIQTTNAVGGTVLTGRSIENLPLNGRQIYMLKRFAPAVPNAFRNRVQLTDSGLEIASCLSFGFVGRPRRQQTLATCRSYFGLVLETAALRNLGKYACFAPRLMINTDVHL